MDDECKPTASLTDEHPWLEDGFLTTPEAASLLGGAVIPLDIRTWCHKGFIRYIKEPFSGKYLVCEADVRKLARECEGPVTTAAVARVMLRRKMTATSTWLK